MDANSGSLVVSISPPASRAFELTLLQPVAQHTRPNSDCNSLEVSDDVLASASSVLYHRNALPTNQTYTARVLVTENIHPQSSGCHHLEQLGKIEAALPRSPRGCHLDLDYRFAEGLRDLYLVKICYFADPAGAFNCTLAVSPPSVM